MDSEPFPTVGAHVFTGGLTFADPWPTRGCLAIDIVFVTSVTACLIGAAQMLHWEIKWLVTVGLLGLAIMLLATLHRYRSRGRAVGGLILGLRNVDDCYYLPALPLIHRTRGTVRPVMIDIRHGPDPLAAVLTPWAGLRHLGQQVGEPGETNDSLPRHAAPAGSAVIVFESGQVHWFTGNCVLGRSPVNPEGDALALPDMSRRLAANHLVAAEGTDASGRGNVWIADLGSSTGTWLDHEGQTSRLLARTPTVLVPGDRARLGDYWFRVDRLHQ